MDSTTIKKKVQNKISKPADAGWMGLGATWFRGRCPCPRHRVGMRWSGRSFLSQTILWCNFVVSYITKTTKKSLQAPKVKAEISYKERNSKSWKTSGKNKILPHGFANVTHGKHKKNSTGAEKAFKAKQFANISLGDQLLSPISRNLPAWIPLAEQESCREFFAFFLSQGFDGAGKGNKWLPLNALTQGQSISSAHQKGGFIVL